MIVPAMTFEEIHREVLKDTRTIVNKIADCGKFFKKMVLNSHRFPVSKTHEFKTLQRKNVFIVILKALKRNHWKMPFVGVYTVYSRPEGNYAVVPELRTNRVCIYPPHFFKRFRERILKDDSLSNEEMIHDFFSNDWGSLGTLVNKDFETVYYAFEKDDHSNTLSFVGVNVYGYFFGEKQKNYDLIKTIISEDMLFESQKKTFAKLKADFKLQNIEAYGLSIIN